MGTLYWADGHFNLSTWVRQLQSEFNPWLLVAMECHVSGNGTRPALMLISAVELIGATERVVQGRSAWKLIYPCLPLTHCQAVNVCSDGVTESNLGVHGLEEMVHQDKAEVRSCGSLRL